LVAFVKNHFEDGFRKGIEQLTGYPSQEGFALLKSDSLIIADLLLPYLSVPRGSSHYGITVEKIHYTLELF
jgi:hypothetical protein